MGANRVVNKGSGGFTLIELILVIVLATIMSVFLGRMLLSGVDSFDYASTRKNALRQARIAMAQVSRELRQIRDSSGITSATSTSISFYNVNDQAITIELDGSDLERNDISIAGDVTSFTLAYFDQSGNSLSTPVTDCTQIRRIDISLVIQVGNQQVSLETEVHPRNL